MTEQELVQVNRLQSNLLALRKIAGWTTEQLAQKMGCSKQTVSNLENKEDHTQMKLTQYMALTQIIEKEIADNPQNELLQRSYDVLIKQPDPNEQETKKRENVIETLASAKSGGKSDDELLIFLSILITGVGIVSGLTFGNLFDKIFSKKL